jgi:hypothetical protein
MTIAAAQVKCWRRQFNIPVESRFNSAEHRAEVWQ